ncbi:MAG: hypothetical protein AB1742_11805 [bacterium]
MKKAAIALLLAACSAPAGAAASGIWTQAGVASFYEGKFDGAALTSEGEIVLAPKAGQKLVTHESYVWTAALDDGALWAGTGMKALVFKLDARGRQQTDFLPGTNVSSIAADAKGSVYVAGFPPAKVFRFDRRGKKELYADIPARYIWDMALDADGRLYVAAGSPGGIYRVAKANEPEQLLVATETHVLSLAFDDKGALYAGGGPKGLIYRLAPGGEVSVIQNLGDEEAYRMMWLNGGLLVAANRPQAPAPGRPPGPPREEPVSFPVPATIGRQKPANPARMYQILPNGDKRMVFQSPDHLILSLRALDDGSVLVGTGNDGHLYRVDVENELSMLTQLPVSQILDIERDGDTTYLATGLPGSVYTMDETLMSEGRFESTVNDVSTVGIWGNAWAEADVPPGASVTFQTRTGNTPEPDATWNPWSDEYSSLPHPVQSPPGRYIQYAMKLTSGNARVTPSVKEINVAYLTPNQPPEIAELNVSPKPAERAPAPPPPLPLPAPPQITQGAQEQEKQPEGAAPQGTPPAPQRQRNLVVGTMRATGRIIIAWKVSDPDNDPLWTDIHFRRLPAETWTLLEEEFAGREFSWDTSSIPDGKYEVKIRVTDEPGNPEGEEEEDFRISDPFIVDNTRPVVKDVKVKPAGGGAEITGAVEDATSTVSALEYSLDDFEWKVLFPTDRIFDSQTEEFRITLKDVEPGDHVVLIRARDFVGNVGSHEARFSK